MWSLLEVWSQPYVGHWATEAPEAQAWLWPCSQHWRLAMCTGLWVVSHSSALGGGRGQAPSSPHSVCWEGTPVCVRWSWRRAQDAPGSVTPLVLNNWTMILQKFLVKQQFESILNIFRLKNRMKRQWIKPKKNMREVTHPLLFSQNTSFGRITGFGELNGDTFRNQLREPMQSLKCSHNGCL